MLIKLLSSDGKLIEEELQSCTQFRAIIESYEANINLPSYISYQHVYPVPVRFKELEQLLQWGRLMRGRPFETRTPLTTKDEHIDADMTMEKRCYLSRYTIEELHMLVRGCGRLQCWRLQREIYWLLDKIDEVEKLQRNIFKFM